MPTALIKVKITPMAAITMMIVSCRLIHLSVAFVADFPYASRMCRVVPHTAPALSFLENPIRRSHLPRPAGQVNGDVWKKAQGCRRCGRQWRQRQRFG